MSSRVQRGFGFRQSGPVVDLSASHCRGHSDEQGQARLATRHSSAEIGERSFISTSVPIRLAASCPE